MLKVISYIIEIKDNRFYLSNMSINLSLFSLGNNKLLNMNLYLISV